MKKLLIALTLIALALSSLVLYHVSGTQAAGTGTHIPQITHKSPSLFALEHQTGHPNPGNHIPSNLTCGSGATKGNLLIEVSEHVINDAVPGEYGYWALAAYTRIIRVWNMGPDTWCAVVTYNGTFAAQADEISPGSIFNSTRGVGTLTGDEVGSLKGGYVGQFTGALQVIDPANWPLRGKINGGQPVDYQCEISPDGSSGCDNSPAWVAQYFTNESSVQVAPWEWTYVGHDGPNAPDAGTPDGTWYNFSTGDSGDILDVDQ